MDILSWPGAARLRTFWKLYFQNDCCFSAFTCFAMLCWSWSVNTQLWRENPSVQRQCLVPEIHWPLKSLQPQNSAWRRASLRLVGADSVLSSDQTAAALYKQAPFTLTSRLGLPCEDRTNSGFDAALRAPRWGLGQFKQTYLRAGQPAVKNPECPQSREAGGNCA